MHRCFVAKQWLDEWSMRPGVVPEDVYDRLVKVVRIKPDEKIALFDGEGRELQGFLHKDGTVHEGVLVTRHVQKVRLILLQAALEEAKISETIKRTTEFGIDEILIFPSNRSDNFVLSKLQKRAERLRALAIDAARQSGRLFVPKISFAKDLMHAVQSAQVEQGIYGDVIGNKKLSELLKEQQPARSYGIVAGPEGGLSDEEKQWLTKQHFHPTLWAPFTLRSELASLAAITLINAQLGRA